MFTVILTMMISTFVSCSSKKDEKKPPDYDKYVSQIGKKKDDVLAKLKVTDVKENEKVKGMYSLPDKVKFQGYDFDVSLLFNASDDSLYGFWYTCEYQDSAEKAAKAAEDLLKKLTEIYGEPDTYPDKSDRLKGQEDLKSSLEGKELFTGTETWNLESPDDFVLNLMVTSNEGSDAVIALQYQIQSVPGQ